MQARFGSRGFVCHGALSCLVVMVMLLVGVGAAHADDAALDQVLTQLTKAEDGASPETLAKLADSAVSASALPALEALCDDRLSVADGVYYYKDAGGGIHRAATGQVVPAPSGATAVEGNNALRRMVLPLLARLKLTSSDADTRLSGATELAKTTADEEVANLLRAALAKERVSQVHDAMALALAKADLQSTDRARRIAALDALRSVGDSNVKGELNALLERRSDGTYAEPDESIRKAAASARSAIDGREKLVSLVGDLVHGISLGSVLLFAALGLAITFGLMGVINMAHGEMLMLGAYATYSTQQLFQKYLPGHLDAYLIVAIPLAFAVTTLVGILLERTVIRHLYGRQLETLLATWGISLIMIQSVRLLFGAQNVSVANPKLLAGGAEIAHGLVLPYSRIAVVAFVVVVSLAVWALLQRTRLGLLVRAVTQNRAMAACLGVPTSRVDTWIFGLGCGIAGLGGVALSQLGNVGPELGQAYIIDSFMVVVLGGVGRLTGCIVAAAGLGIVNELLEPFAGAVLGKIAVLLIIIVFIQRRPQGLFALKGRVEA